MKKITVILVPFLIAACASAPKQDSSQAAQSSENNTSTAAANVNTASIAGQKVSAAEVESRKVAAEKQELQKGSIYFDFDMFDIKPEYRGDIHKQAEFIKAHKNDIVTVEGNCDERGSSEYNLALGDRRASAARKSLELMGVPANQIKTTSFGEEKPRLLCHEENCLKENRRDDFVHNLN